VCYFIVKTDIMSFVFWGVGRGVLRFWTARYRKTRSNFVGILDFCGVSGNLGVDIIHVVGVV